MQRSKLILGVVLAAGIVAPARLHSAGPEQTHPAFITVEQIARSLAGEGIRLEPRQIHLLSTMTATAPDARLELVRLEPQSEAITRARMRCVDASECIPFYVVIHGMPRAPQVTATPDHAGQHAAKALPVIHRGGKATLEIVSEHMVITMAVVCLEDGRLGEKIKVTSPNTAGTYVGEVLSNKLLRRAL